jgi:hypothetical protein
MAYEITNSPRSTSIIRVVDPGTVTVNIANLSVNSNETITGATIKRVMWSTNGSISIARNSNSTPTLALHGSGDMRFDDYGHTIANTSTGTILITIVTGGTAIIEVSKTAEYATPLVGM